MTFDFAIGANLRKSPYFEATLRAGVKSFSVYNHMLIPAHFGDPDAEPPVPTWEEFIDSRSVDMNDDEERADFLEQYFGSWRCLKSSTSNSN
jgi:hypothetical protein